MKKPRKKIEALLIVRYSRRFSCAFLLAAMLMTLAGIEIAFTHFLISDPPTWLRVLAGVMITLGGAVSLASLCRLVSPKPLLAADDKGLWFLAPFTQSYFVPWDRVTRAQVKGPGDKFRTIRKRLSVGIETDDSFGIPKIFIGLSDPGESEINLDARTLDRPAEEIAATLKLILETVHSDKKE